MYYCALSHSIYETILKKGDERKHNFHTFATEQRFTRLNVFRFKLLDSAQNLIQQIFRKSHAIQALV